MMKILSVSLDRGLYRHIAVSADAEMSAIIADALNAFSFAHEIDAIHLQDVSDDALTVGHKFAFVVNEEYLFKCKVLREEEGDGPSYVVKQSGSMTFYRPQSLMTSKTGIRAMLAEYGIDTQTYALLRQYFRAFVTLYGAISLKEAYRVFNEQNPGLLSSDKFARTAKIASFEEESAIEVSDGYIVDIFASLDEILMAHRGKSLYVPAKETLLRFAEERPLEGTQQEEQMLAFFKRKLPAAEAEDALRDLVESIRLGYGM